MRDFFISYNGADRHWAEWIAWQLESAGYSTFLQLWDIRPGANFVLEMQKAATSCARTVLVLSPNYLRSVYTQPEWAVAFVHDPLGDKRRVVPVMVQQCMPPGLLKQLVYIDIVGLSETAARSTLLFEITPSRVKPTVSPKFPARKRKKGSCVAVQPAFPEPAPQVETADGEIQLASNEPCLDKEAGNTFLRSTLDALVRPNLLRHSPASILMLDIDGLTLINKHHGLRVGNHILVTIAQLLQKNSQIAYSGRSGDDTFYAYAPGVSGERAFRIGEELLRSIEHYPWTDVSTGLRVTCCIGVAEFALTEPAVDCVERAARGFNKAKDRGGNQIEAGPLFIPPLSMGEIRGFSYS